MAKYLDPKADLTFKKIFGEHPDLVMSLLNALLPLETGKEITDIYYLSPERVPRTAEGKDSIVDVYCETKDKRQFIVEMQMYWSNNFMQRVLFNSSKVYVSQLKQGGLYEDLQPVYSLNLIDDIFEPDMEDYYHYYHLVHDKDTKKVIDGFHLVFVELKKFKPQSFSEKKMQVLWLRFLTEINAYTEVVPQELLDNPEISKAIQLVEESAFTREQLIGYDMFWDRVSRDKTIANDLRRSREQLKEAFVKLEETNDKLKEKTDKLEETTGKLEETTGKLEETTKKLYTTALRMKARGFSVKDISEITGMTVEEIESL